MKVVLDTSTLIALLEPRDQYHNAAVDTLKMLMAGGSIFLVPHCVLTELYDNLASEYGKKGALIKVEKLEKSKVLNIMYESGAELDLGRKLFLMYDDVDVSLTDCIVFALMEKRGIRRAFSFDSHFRMRKIEVSP